MNNSKIFDFVTLAEASYADFSSTKTMSELVDFYPKMTKIDFSNTHFIGTQD